MPQRGTSTLDLAQLAAPATRRISYVRRSSILYRLLYGPSVDLRDYEELLVARLESDLSQSAAWKLRKQLTILQRRRQTDDRVLLFLPDDDRGVDPGIKFRNSGDEILLASASIVGKDGGVIRAKAFAYRGVFSSLQFNKSPKRQLTEKPRIPNS